MTTTDTSNGSPGGRLLNSGFSDHLKERLQELLHSLAQMERLNPPVILRDSEFELISRMNVDHDRQAIS